MNFTANFFLELKYGLLVTICLKRNQQRVVKEHNEIVGVTVRVWVLISSRATETVLSHAPPKDTPNSCSTHARQFSCVVEYFTT